MVVILYTHVLSVNTLFPETFSFDITLSWVTVIHAYKKSCTLNNWTLWGIKISGENGCVPGVQVHFSFQESTTWGKENAGSFFLFIDCRWWHDPAACVFRLKQVSIKFTLPEVVFSPTALYTADEVSLLSELFQKPFPILKRVGTAIRLYCLNLQSLVSVINFFPSV